MTSAQGAFCAICLRARRAGESWFLLRENRWTDRLKVLRWHDELLSQPGIHPVCGVAHVQQLVVHWMTTGNMDYPFATRLSEVAAFSARGDSGPRADAEPDTIDMEVLGELAVDRDSVARILVENPELMGCLLAALGDVLLGEGGTRDSSAHDNEFEDQTNALIEVGVD